MNDTAFSQQTQTANKKSSWRGCGEARNVTLNRCDRLNTTLRYPARKPKKSSSISITIKTPQQTASKSIALRNVYSIRAIHSAACAASQIQSGSDKLETIAQKKGPYMQVLLSTTGAHRRNNQPPLPYSLLSRRNGLYPQRPVGSTVHSYRC